MHNSDIGIDPGITPLLTGIGIGIGITDLQLESGFHSKLGIGIGIGIKPGPESCITALNLMFTKYEAYIACIASSKN